METSLTWLDRLATSPSGPDWQRLVDVYTPLLHGWFGGTGINPADRDDLVQEVLMAVVVKVAEFEHRGPGAFRAWLRAIVANQARKFFRDRNSHAVVDLEQLAGDDTHLSRLWDREHDEFLAARAMRQVETEFATQTWQAFLRQVVHGRLAADVAAELGCSVNSVLLAKSRVLKRLRGELHGLLD